MWPWDKKGLNVGLKVQNKKSNKKQEVKHENQGYGGKLAGKTEWGGQDTLRWDIT